MTLNDFAFQKWFCSTFLRLLTAKDWIAAKWMKIDQANLRTETAIGSRASHKHYLRFFCGPNHLHSFCRSTKTFKWFTDVSCEDTFQINSTCYKIHKEKVRWFTAVNRCLSNNATLAVFDDNVRQYVPRRSLLSENAWIGLLKSWWTWPGSNILMFSFAKKNTLCK